LQSIKINWKDPAKALTKLYPRVADEDDDDLPAESGSFFNFFEEKSDPFNVSASVNSASPGLLTDWFLRQIGEAIATEIFPNAIDYFMGDVEGSEIDSEEEEDEEDDDDEAEIDLEKPRPKKKRI